MTGNFPTFEMPKAVGTFSLDIHRKYHSDFSELRYLTFDIPESGSCKVKFDLRKGISDAIDKDQESIKQKMLDDMLIWILQERKVDNGSIVDLQQPLRPLLTEFVCFRGLLTALIFTPYENQEGWKILATKFQNTIYLWQIKEQRENGNNFSRNPRNAKRMQEMTMWGFKFEQYLCSGTIQNYFMDFWCVRFKHSCLLHIQLLQNQFRTPDNLSTPTPNFVVYLKQN
jgi:RAT1-interacting protein